MIEKLEKDVSVISEKITSLKEKGDYSVVADKKIKKLESQMLELLSKILKIEKKIDKRLG